MKITSIVTALLILIIILLVGNYYNLNRIKVGTVALVTILVLTFMFKVQEEFSADIAQTISTTTPILQQASGLKMDNTLSQATGMKINNVDNIQNQLSTTLSPLQSPSQPIQAQAQAQVQQITSMRSNVMQPRTDVPNQLSVQITNSGYSDKIRDRPEINGMKNIVSAGLSGIQRFATSMASMTNNIDPKAVSNYLVDTGVNSYVNFNKAVVENTNFDNITSSNVVIKDKLCLGDKCITPTQFNKLAKMLE